MKTFYISSEFYRDNVAKLYIDEDVIRTYMEIYADAILDTIVFIC